MIFVNGFQILLFFFALRFLPVIHSVLERLVYLLAPQQAPMTNFPFIVRLLKRVFMNHPKTEITHHSVRIIQKPHYTPN